MENGLGNILEKRDKIVKLWKKFDKKWKSFKTLLEMFFYREKANLEKKVKNSSNTLNFVVRKKQRKKLTQFLQFVYNTWW